jgi:hypothetical protein
MGAAASLRDDLAMTYAVTLRTWEQAKPTLAKLTEWVRQRTLNGRAVVLQAADECRSTEQNAMLHALLTDISKRRKWAGERQDVETWKRLLVGAWCRARGEQIKMLPAIDGHGCEIVFRRTSKMSKADVSELIDWIEAWDALA